MISEIVSEFVERLAQSGATPEIIAMFVTFASRVERDVWRDGRDAKQKSSDRSRAYRKRRRDAKRDGDHISSLSLLTSIAKPLTDSPKEDVSVAGQELNDWPRNYQQLFWARFPLKKAKRAALKALDAVKKQKRTTFTQLMAALDRYIIKQDPRFYCHATTWLNQDRFLDEYAEDSTPQANGGWKDGLPTTEELRAKYEKGAKMGQDKPLVQDGLRPRDDEQGMVGTKARNPGIGSLGGVLRANGMDAASLAGKLKNERAGSGHDALSVAGMATDDDGGYPFEGAV